jgi:hypothetical protein
MMQCKLPADRPSTDNCHSQNVSGNRIHAWCDLLQKAGQKKNLMSGGDVGVAASGPMLNINVGVLGHVDSGKTSLGE